MDKRIIIGLVAGFIVGVLTSYFLVDVGGPGNNLVESLTALPTLLATILGLVVSFASTKITPKRNFYIASTIYWACIFSASSSSSRNYI